MLPRSFPFSVGIGVEPRVDSPVDSLFVSVDFPSDPSPPAPAPVVYTSVPRSCSPLAPPGPHPPLGPMPGGDKVLSHLPQSWCWLDLLRRTLRNCASLDLLCRIQGRRSDLLCRPRLHQQLCYLSDPQPSREVFENPRLIMMAQSEVLSNPTLLFLGLVICI